MTDHLRRGKQRNLIFKSIIRTITTALVLTVGAGATPRAMAQPGDSGHGAMHWGNTNQYGAFEILTVVLGVAIVALLMAIVFRDSAKSRTHRDALQRLHHTQSINGAQRQCNSE